MDIFLEGGQLFAYFIQKLDLLVKSIHTICDFEDYFEEDEFVDFVLEFVHESVIKQIEILPLRNFLVDYILLQLNPELVPQPKNSENTDLSSTSSGKAASNC